MVHLATVASDKEKNSSVIEGLDRQSLGQEHDSVNATVYGSSYAGQVKIPAYLESALS